MVHKENIIRYKHMIDFYQREKESVHLSKYDKYFEH